MKFLVVSAILLILTFMSAAHAEQYTIDIPQGASNPELNTEAQVWYDPPGLTLKVGDTITWYNDDREGHTVTSGTGSGRFGWMGDDFGESDDIFDSGRFMPGKSWSHKFVEPGTFSYYCTIHPWMEGVLVVEKQIPDFPHDISGKRLELPAIQYTPDQKIEVDLAWDPPVIKTHERVQVVYQFYDSQTNSNLADMEYNFVIIQNGNEIFRDEGINQIGGDYRNFVFTEAGSIIIRIEGIRSSSMFAEESVTVFGDVQNIQQRSVDFTSIVYDNPKQATHDTYNIKPAQRLTIYYELMLFIILVPGIMFVVALLWLKKKPKTQHQVRSAI